VFGLDINLDVLCVKSPELKLVQQTVTMIHLPSPAVKFTEGERPRWYLVHWN